MQSYMLQLAIGFFLYNIAQFLDVLGRLGQPTTLRSLLFAGAEFS
jgi:hypothetical protein